MKSLTFHLRGSHALRLAFPCHSVMSEFYNFTGHPHVSLQPRSKRFGLLRFRSPLLTESLLISFPVLLRWFTSHGLALRHYFIHASQFLPLSRRVTPFGYPRVNGYVPLSAAFRSLSRPSSPYSSTGIRHEPIFPWPYLPSALFLLRLQADIPFSFTA